MSDQAEVDKLIVANYGAKNLSKVKRNMRDGVLESKRRFIEKYPYADLAKFEYQAELLSNGDIDKYVVYYKVDDVSSYDITSNMFLSNKKWVWYLHQWEKIWGTHGTVQPYIKNPVGTQYKVNLVKVYVNNNQSFDATFPEFDIDGDVYENDIESDSLLASVFAAYLTTYACGISTEHLTYNDNTPKIITSIARYHLYYHMRRFIRQPIKMKRYITEDIRLIIMGNKPIKYDWTTETTLGYLSKSGVEDWISRQPPNSVRNVKTGWYLAGPMFTYEKRGAWTAGGHLDDYKLFIATKSNGLTSMGQLLFQQSMESYVYCVLGAQARTRWSIVGGGAMSLQTQSVFLKLVSNTVVQDDHTIAITNMRRAINDTNVILNMAVSPGIILIPSNMIIQTEMVSGYNNILTLASKNMEFGVNSAVNYMRSDTDGDTGTATPTVGEKTVTDIDGAPIYNDTVSDNPADAYKEYLYLFITGTVGGVLISKYVL